MVWSVVALIGLARSGRELLAAEDDDDDRVRRPGLRLLVGLALLTGGGWLIGQGLRDHGAPAGIPQTLLGNTALAATIEAEELARFAVPARRGRPEIGLGSIAGTIVHFAALNAGIIAIVKPLTLGPADDSLLFAGSGRQPGDPGGAARRPQATWADRGRRADRPVRRLRRGRDRRLDLIRAMFVRSGGASVTATSDSAASVRSSIRPTASVTQSLITV